MRAPRRTERELFATANEQHGLLRHQDLIAGGLDRSDITRRLAAHRLNRVHHQVYAFGHTALTEHGRWLAGLWACGEADVLSHFTAAAYHGWPVAAADSAVHVSTTGALRHRDGLRIHRVKTLPRTDIVRQLPFRVTSLARTIVDLADVMTWRDYRSFADRLPQLPVRYIVAAQDRAPKRPGRGLVTRLTDADDTHTKSEFERRFLRFVSDRGLPRPDGLNVGVAGHKADCVYRGVPRLVVELDGRAHHQRRSQMRADRRRDSDYQLAGFRILRLVWDDLHDDEADDTADRLRRMLRVTSCPDMGHKVTRKA